MQLTEKQLGTVIAIAAVVACGVLADIGFAWTSAAFGLIAFAAVIYCAPEL